MTFAGLAADFPLPVTAGRAEIVELIVLLERVMRASIVRAADAAR